MNIHKIYALIFKYWRKKRFALFVETIRPNLQMRLLDVGGYPWGWLKNEPVVKSIDCLNVHQVNWDSSQAPEHGIRMLKGDARRMPEFLNQEYDIVFSNSVIEHVGSWQDQQSFAREVRRIGKKLWIQTPAKECPIEPHYLAPFVHWLPKTIQKKSLRYLSIYGWLQKPNQEEISSLVDEIRLLTFREFSTLFPDCKIIVEKILFLFPKSFIAYKL
jgi:hypothetical protein